MAALAADLGVTRTPAGEWSVIVPLLATVIAASLAAKRIQPAVQGCPLVDHREVFRVAQPTLLVLREYCDADVMTKAQMQKAFACEDQGVALRKQAKRLVEPLEESGIGVVMCWSDARVEIEQPDGTIELFTPPTGRRFSGAVLVAPRRAPETLSGIQPDEQLLRRVKDYFR